LERWNSRSLPFLEHDLVIALITAFVPSLVASVIIMQFYSGNQRFLLS
jgi:hypothetical protein